MRTSLRTAATILTALAVSNAAIAQDKTVAGIAQADDQFSTLVAAAQAAGLVDALNDPSKKVTVFAPTNAAFEKLPAGAVEDLLKPENKKKLQRILKYHVVEGPVSAEDLKASGEAKTLQGSSLKLMDGGMVGNDNTSAKLVKTDINASNGMVHVIDSVLLPGKMKLGGEEKSSGPPKKMDAVSEGLPDFVRPNRGGKSPAKGNGADLPGPAQSDPPKSP